MPAHIGLTLPFSVGKTEGDGGKWFCGEYFKQNKECVIFSIGSNGDFAFEAGMYEMSGGRCKVPLVSDAMDFTQNTDNTG